MRAKHAENEQVEFTKMAWAYYDVVLANISCMQMTYLFFLLEKTRFQKIILQGYSIPSNSAFMFISKKNEKIGNNWDSWSSMKLLISSLPNHLVCIFNHPACLQTRDWTSQNLFCFSPLTVRSLIKRGFCGDTRFILLLLAYYNWEIL